MRSFYRPALECALFCLPTKSNWPGYDIFHGAIMYFNVGLLLPRNKTTVQASHKSQRRTSMTTILDIIINEDQSISKQHLTHPLFLNRSWLFIFFIAGPQPSLPLFLSLPSFTLSVWDRFIFWLYVIPHMAQRGGLGCFRVTTEKQSRGWVSTD